MYFRDTLSILGLPTRFHCMWCSPNTYSHIGLILKCFPFHGSKVFFPYFQKIKLSCQVNRFRFIGCLVSYIESKSEFGRTKRSLNRRIDSFFASASKSHLSDFKIAAFILPYVFCQY